MSISRILTLSDLTDAIEIISDIGEVVFDWETNGLSFKDEVFSLGLKSNEARFWLPFETINDYRKKPKVIKEKKMKLKKVKLHENQTSMFGKEVEKIIPGLNDTYITLEKIIEKEKEITFLTFEECYPLLKLLFEDKEIKKIAHHFKFDASFFIYRDIHVKNWYFDTMLAAWQLDEDRKGNRPYSLKTLHSQEFGSEAIQFADLTKNTAYYDLPYNIQEEYNVGDCDKTDDLRSVYESEIFDGGDNENFFVTQMMNICEVLTYMYIRGIEIDVDGVHKYLEREFKNLDKMNESILLLIGATAGCDSDLNINSDQQLAKLFYDQLHYKNPFGITVKPPIVSKRKVDKHVLKRWAVNNNCLISKQLLIYRKLRDTIKFVDPDKPKSLMAKIDPETNRVYPTLNQHRTVMHRLSGSNPNTQNLPRKGGIVRESIIAGNGKKLLILDYAQIELRCFAHYSKDPELIKAFDPNSKTDIHEITRKNIIAPLFPDLDKVEQRTLAKNVNFGIWYGITAYGLAAMLNIDKIKAQFILDKAFSLYYVNKQWITKMQTFVRKNKWVGNSYGGKRRFYHVDFNKISPKYKYFIYKEAVHFTVSGTAACILKNAMWNIHRKYFDNKEVNMLLQIHDELILEIPDQFDPQPITNIMIKPDGIFTIPLEVDFEIKNRWSK